MSFVDKCYDKFVELSRVGKAVVIAVLGVALWLGIHSLVIVVEGNRNPSLPMSTPCPVLNYSNMPLMYQLEASTGYHFRTRVKPAVGLNGAIVPFPPGPPLDIIVENRCFNGGIGSVFLWVNNQLAAFSRIDREIYDCHGERIFDTDYYATTDGIPQLKVRDANNVPISFSDIPDYGSDLIMNGQPENTPAVLISSTNRVTVQNPLSAAADPRLVVILHAVSFFTEKYSTRSTRRSSSSRSRSSSSTSTTQRQDGCNGFVFIGGIISIIFFLIVLVPAIALCYRKYQQRRSPKGALTTHTSSHQAMQLNEIRNPDSEAIPDASFPQYHAASKPYQQTAAVLPNSEGFMLSGAAIYAVNGVYRRQTQTHTMRNGAPTFAQPAQPSAEIYLDCSGSNPFWAINYEGRMVYHMLPNPLDPSYNSFPNIQGTWDCTDARPGDFVAAPVMSAIHDDVAVPMNTEALVSTASV